MHMIPCRWITQAHWNRHHWSTPAMKLRYCAVLGRCGAGSRFSYGLSLCLSTGYGASEVGRLRKCNATCLSSAGISTVGESGANSSQIFTLSQSLKMLAPCHSNSHRLSALLRYLNMPLSLLRAADDWQPCRLVNVIYAR